MLTDKQIEEMACQIVEAQAISPEEFKNKLSYSLGLLYADILAEVENQIEFKLAGIDIPETKVIVPESQQLIGRMPWNIRKNRLEQKFKKTDSTEESEA